MEKLLNEYVGTAAWNDAEIVVTEAAIRRYAETVGETRLETTSDGRLIAPPSFLPPFAYGGPITPDGRRHKPGEPDILPFTAPHRVMGECEIEFFEPIIAGDTIRSSTLITDVSQKQGSAGTLLFLVTETSYATPDGKLKRLERWTIIVPPIKPRDANAE